VNDTEHKKRMQVLRMAEIILKEENTKQFNAEYRGWIASNDVSWRTRGIKLAVPVAPSPPTEEAIVARALEFYKAAVVDTASPLATAAPAAIISSDNEGSTDTVPTITEQHSVTTESTEVGDEAPLPVVDLVLDPVRKIFEAPASVDIELNSPTEQASVTDVPTLTVPTSGVRDMLASLFQQKSQSNKTRSLNV
jgi:hypothetical protein